MQSTFLVYDFYDPTMTPWILGAVFAALVGYCLIGGGQRIIKVTSIMVPVMGAIYILAAWSSSWPTFPACLRYLP